MRYKSQPYPLFILICCIIATLYIPFLFVSRPFQLTCTIILTVMLFILLLREYYEINGDLLLIYRGFSKFAIAIPEIETLNIARYGKRLGLEISAKSQVIVIFPKDLEALTMQLMKINPDIRLNNGDMSAEPV